MVSSVFGAIALLLAGLLVPMAGPSLRPTTLRGSWRWAIVACLGWAAVAVLTRVTNSPGPLDRAWYAAAVVTLIPFVHVLGARRPVSRSWNGFVVLPMLAVLGLPLVTSGPWTGPFEIDLPPLLGFLLVLVMGTGNYFGTRYTLPTLLLACGLAVAVVAGSTVRPEWFPTIPTSRTIAVGSFAIALLSAGRRSTGAPATGDSAADRLDALWREFRDLFGIVWAKRVMDRVNESLAAADCKSRLDLDGIRWTDPDPATATKVVEETFAWLLKRFADPPWPARYGVTLRDGTS